MMIGIKLWIWTIIGAKQQSRFFVQLDIDVGLKADVSVVPLSQPVLE